MGSAILGPRRVTVESTNALTVAEWRGGWSEGESHNLGRGAVHNSVLNPGIPRVIHSRGGIRGGELVEGWNREVADAAGGGAGGRRGCVGAKGLLHHAWTQLRNKQT